MADAVLFPSSRRYQNRPKRWPGNTKIWHDGIYAFLFCRNQYGYACYQYRADLPREVVRKPENLVFKVFRLSLCG